jgi:hypothetical protein
MKFVILDGAPDCRGNGSELVLGELIVGKGEPHISPAQTRLIGKARCGSRAGQAATTRSNINTTEIS